MSKPSWRASLRDRLKRIAENNPAGRMAIVGIGNDLRGDDAAGVIIARRLMAQPGGLPENFSGVLRRFNPDAILFVDAAVLGAPAGEIQFVEWDRLVEHGFSHGLPLSTLAKFLRAEIGCWMGLLAIQGESLNFGDAISPSARRAIRQVVNELKKLGTG
jgi:hydrogenase 3 maturation protease